MVAISPALARSVFHDAPDALIVIDAFGTVWFANRQVCALFGYSAEEIIGEGIERLLPERFRARHVGHRGVFGNNVMLPGSKPSTLSKSSLFPSLDQPILTVLRMLRAGRFPWFTKAT